MKACPQCGLRYPDESTFCFVDGASLEPMADPRVGTTISGRYVIEAAVGEGGMATVYRARHKLVDRPCAVKIMNPALARDKVVKERFRREAKAAQKLAHPNIIEILDHGETEDGTSFLVMELLVGESLADRVERGAIAAVEALPLMIQIARALARAHDFEVVHRDLKPENTFLARSPSDGSEVIKLLDFGIARSMQDSRLTGVGEVFGTPQYMAPERITSIDAGPAADLYAIGVIFFEMLTGRLPFDAPDIPTFFVKHLKEKPPRVRALVPSVPEALDALIDKLLAKNPKERPVDAHSVHADLVAVARAVGAKIPPDPALGQQPSSREPAPSLPPVALDRWARRTVIFDQMLQQVYGTSPPGDLARLLDEIRHLLREVHELRTSGVVEQRKLEQIEDREREGRQRFGAAMDTLGVDASAARREARAAAEGIDTLASEASRWSAALLAAHKEILQWEGRSSFQEPYSHLSTAYRKAADTNDAWLTARKAEKAARGTLDEKERVVTDLEFQIQELRGALARFEQSIETEKSTQEATMTSMGKRADVLEDELLHLSSRFCAPLRGRPELASFFKELEGSQAA